MLTHRDSETLSCKSSLHPRSSLRLLWCRRRRLQKNISTRRDPYGSCCFTNTAQAADSLVLTQVGIHDAVPIIVFAHESSRPIEGRYYGARCCTCRRAREDIASSSSSGIRRGGEESLERVARLTAQTLDVTRCSRNVSRERVAMVQRSRRSSVAAIISKLDVHERGGDVGWRRRPVDGGRKPGRPLYRYR